MFRRLVVIAPSLIGGVPAAAASPPAFVPSSFVDRVDNPWFPLRPGTVFVYRGSKDSQPSREIVTVSQRTRVAVLTREWTPLEAGVLDQKLYVRGVGVVREETVRGGSESAALVVVRRG